MRETRQAKRLRDDKKKRESRESMLERVERSRARGIEKKESSGE